MINQQEKEENNSFRHQFFDNVPSDNLFCEKCKELCQEPKYSLCLWCHKVYHLDCISKCLIHKQPCEQLANLQRCILTPDEITFDQKTNQFIISQTTAATKTPIIAIINSKSGAQQGAQALSMLFKFLNPLQVIDLCPSYQQQQQQQLQQQQQQQPSLLQQQQSSLSLEKKLRIFEQCKNARIIVGGGDGTVSSVINQIKSSIEQWRVKNPAVAILPLGTGNDLSIALDWGRKCQTGYSDVQQMLQQVHNGKPILFDRWKVIIDGHEKVMFNYCSIGLDAQLCMEFHQYREKYPNLFKSRFVNKFVYGQCGATNLFSNDSQKTPNLKEHLILKCNNEILEMPDLQNLIFLNIPNCHGGVKNLWQAQQQQQKPWNQSEIKNNQVQNYYQQQSQLPIQQQQQQQQTQQIQLMDFFDSPNKQQQQQQENKIQQIDLMTGDQLEQQQNSSSVNNNNQSINDNQQQQSIQQQLQQQSLSSNSNNNSIMPQFHSWNNSMKSQSMSDCQLEAIGVQSILHLGQIQVNLDRPLQICQGKKIDIIVNEGLPHLAMQIDGEPFLVEPPFKIQITHLDQVYMLSNSESEGKIWESKILGCLEQAEQEQIITSQQKSILLQRLLDQQ